VTVHGGLDADPDRDEAMAISDALVANSDLRRAERDREAAIARRDAAVLRLRATMTQAQIAAILGVTDGVVQSIDRRGRRKG
jgi:DNA-directed RNA polymerase specialized sigma24 family protein